jgi:hypothetical protein
MSKKQASGSEISFLTRRDVLALGGAVAATSLYFPTSLIRSAAAQTSPSGVQYNQTVIGQLPDYYISPTGSTSTGDGSAANPWGIDALGYTNNSGTYFPGKSSTYAGKVVGLMNGTYGLYTLLGLPRAGDWSGDNRLQIKPGSATQPTIIVSQTPQGAILDGQRATIQAAAATLDWGDGLIGPCTYPYGHTGAGITIDGLKFVGGNYRYITNYGGYGRGGNGNNGCDNLTVRNCWFTDLSYVTCQSQGKNSSMFYSEGQDHIYVQNCRFDGGNAPSDGGRYNSCQFYSPTNDTLVEYCTVIASASNNSWGGALYWKVGAGPGHNNPVARYNYLDCSAMTSQGSRQQGPISFDGCSTSTSVFQIYNNIFIAALGNPNIYAGPLGQVSGFAGAWDIHDNTFLGNWSSQGNFFGPWDNLIPKSQNFYRNIICPTSGGGGGQNGDFDLAAANVTGNIDYNIYPASSVKLCVGNGTSAYTSLSSWQSARGVDMHSVQRDPGFVGTGTEAAKYMVTGGAAATFASDGGQVGAWRAASQVGSSIGGGTVISVPDPPSLSVS